MMDAETKKYLDSLSDDEFIFLLSTHFSISMPIWERCTKEEYEEHTPQRPILEGKITTEQLVNIVKEVFHSDIVYRRVPIWHNGGGIYIQLSGKSPDDYYYEKQTGTQKCLALGGDMIEYCKTRECMAPYFENKVKPFNEL